MRDALKQFISCHTKCTAYIDFIPDVKTQADATGIFCYSDDPQGDGSGWQRYQIQVRRKTYSQAYDESKLLYKLLDSGEDEEPVVLCNCSPCFIRHRNGPKVFDRGPNYSTFYFEISVFYNG